jgi:hypothetical protein
MTRAPRHAAQEDWLMDQLQTRLDALEQQMHAMNRRLHWWRGLACGAAVLAVLTWALPAVVAQEDARARGQKGLAQRVAALEELLTPFSREKNEIFITGANLHLVNGLGSTDCVDEQAQEIPDCPNGLGNLIVGYNESRNNPLDPDERTGSHNVVVGPFHNFSRVGGLVVGDFNTISGDFAAVSGGERNTASGLSAAVSGGINNTASGFADSVSGGEFNTASGGTAAVSGGVQNLASGRGSAVSGGGSNTALGEFSAVSGGGRNTASGLGAVVSGGGRDPDPVSPEEGAGNTASGDLSSVSGGQNITQDTAFGWSAGSEAEEVVVGNFRSP